MEENLIKITPDKEKAKSILKMVEKTLEMINSLDINKFPSNITKEYYEVIRELLKYYYFITFIPLALRILITDLSILSSLISPFLTAFSITVII